MSSPFLLSSFFFRHSLFLLFLSPSFRPSILQALVRELNRCLYRCSSSEAPPPPFPLACCVTRDAFRLKTAGSRSSQSACRSLFVTVTGFFRCRRFFSSLTYSVSWPCSNTFMPSVRVFPVVFHCDRGCTGPLGCSCCSRSQCRDKCALVHHSSQKMSPKCYSFEGWLWIIWR